MFSANHFMLKYLAISTFILFLTACESAEPMTEIEERYNIETNGQSEEAIAILNHEVVQYMTSSDFEVFEDNNRLELNQITSSKIDMIGFNLIRINSEPILDEYRETMLIGQVNITIDLDKTISQISGTANGFTLEQYDVTLFDPLTDHESIISNTSQIGNADGQLIIDGTIAQDGRIIIATHGALDVNQNDRKSTATIYTSGDGSIYQNNEDYILFAQTNGALNSTDPSLKKGHINSILVTIEKIAKIHP